jgi:hypothetical protein
MRGMVLRVLYLRQMPNPAIAQACAVCSSLRCAQNSCYGLMVAAISDVAWEGESLPALLKGIAKILLSNYGAGLAETVTTV